jgi:hypothetical protein
MLPPNLAKLKEVLIAKTVQKRTSGEDAILAELEAIDADAKISETLRAKDTSPRKYAVYDGPSGSCPCCGRAI